MPVVDQPRSNEYVEVARHGAGIDDIVGTDELIDETFGPVTGLIIKQNEEVAEIVTGTETGNSYQVMDQLGNPLVTVEEETFFCCRLCFRGYRKYSLKVMKGMTHMATVQSNKDVCFCGQRIRVLGPTGDDLGEIVKECILCFCCNPDFFVHAKNGQTLYKINSPCSLKWCTCCRDVDFHIYNVFTGDEIGVVSRKAQDLAVQTLSDVDTYNVRFNADLTPVQKLLIMSAGFAIDFAFYEDKAGRKM